MRIFLLSIILLPTVAFAQIEKDTTQANIYFQLGDSISDRGAYDQSNSYFKKALKLYENNEVWDKVSYCYNKMSRNYSSLGKLDSCVISAQSALGNAKLIEKGREVQEALAYDNIGINHEIRGEYKEAKELYEKALELRQNSQEDDPLGLINSFENLGIISEIIGEYEKSLSYHFQALEARREILEEDNARVATSKFNIAKIYLRLGEYDKTLFYSLEALPTIQRDLGEGNSVTLNIYNILGRVYQLKNDVTNAHKYYDKLLKGSLQLPGDSRPITSAAYNNLALLYKESGSYNKALDGFKRSLLLFEDVYGSDHPNMALIYNNIGECYNLLGSPEKALEFHNKSLEISKNKFGENHRQVALSFNQLGITSLNKKDYHLALEYFEKALKINQDNIGDKSLYVALNYQNIGNAHRSIGNYELALDFYIKSIKLIQDRFGSKHAEIARAYNQISLLYEEQGNFENALDNLAYSIEANTPNSDQQSINDNSSLNLYLDYNGMLSAVVSKGRILKKQFSQTSDVKTLESSLEQYRIGDDLIDNIRKSYGNFEDKLGFGRISRNTYLGAIETCVLLFEKTKNKDFKREAFYFSGKGKTGSLRDAHSDVAAIAKGGVPNDLIQLEVSIKSDLSYYRSKVNKLRQNASSNSDDIKLLTEKLFSTSERLDSLLNTLENQYPAYYKIKYGGNRVLIEDIQKELGADTKVLDYFLGDSTGFVFLLDKTGVDIVELSNSSDIEDKVALFREQIRPHQQDSSLVNSFNNFVKTSQTLYQELISRPFNDVNFSNTKKLIVIPDGILNYLPFELLIRELPKTQDIDYLSLSYLLKDVHISYTYTSQLLFEKDKNIKNAPSNLITFAPSYNNVNDSVTHYLPAQFRDALHPLEWNTKEVYELHKYLDGSNYENENATEENFKNNVNGYGVIHLAMHALIDDENPMLSRLVFTQDGDSIEDGYLHTFEIYNMRLNADLAVLSACETGAGKLFKGEGVMSLARAFSYAGVPSVVMSHWQVDDKSTSELMNFFYNNLAAGMSKSEALRKAKLDFLENADVQQTHPYYWGSFVVLGDNSSIVSNQLFTKWYFIVGLIVVVGIIGLMISRSKKR